MAPSPKNGWLGVLGMGLQGFGTAVPACVKAARSKLKLLVVRLRPLLKPGSSPKAVSTVKSKSLLKSSLPFCEKSTSANLTSIKSRLTPVRFLICIVTLAAPGPAALAATLVMVFVICQTLSLVTRVEIALVAVELKLEACQLPVSAEA